MRLSGTWDITKVSAKRLGQSWVAHLLGKAEPSKRDLQLMALEDRRVLNAALAALVDPGGGADVTLDLSGIDADELTISTDGANTVFSLSGGDGWDATLDDGPTSPFVLRNGDTELVVDSNDFADLKVAFFSGATLANDVSQTTAISIDDVVIGDGNESAGAVLLTNVGNEFGSIGVVASTDVAIVDATSIGISQIESGSGSVHITSITGSIDDASDDGSGGDGPTNIVASTASLAAQTGIGVGDEIDLDVDVLAVQNLLSGSVQVSDSAGGLTLGNVGTLSTSTLTDGGTIDSASFLTVDHSITSADGDVELVADGDITLNAAITTYGGDVSVDSDWRIVSGADGDIDTRPLSGSSLDAGSVTIAGGVGGVLLDGDVSTTSADSDTNGGDITITAASGSITLNGLLTTTDGGGLGGSGNVFVQALDGDVQINAPTTALTSGTGPSGQVTLIASDGIAGPVDQGHVVVATTVETHGEVQVSAERDVVLTGSIRSNGADVNLMAGRDVRLGTADAATGQILVDAGARIIDETVAEDANLVGQSAILRAVDGIGGTFAGGDINTALSQLDVTNSTSGGIFISNAGALELTSLEVASDNLAVSGVAGGGIISAASPLTISASAITSRGITYTAVDDTTDGTPATDDHLTVVGSGVRVRDTSGDLTLSAGDDLILSVGTVVEVLAAGATLTLNIDAGNADAGAARAELRGRLQTVDTTIVLNGSADGGSITIDSGVDAGDLLTDNTVDGLGSNVHINAAGGVFAIDLIDSGDSTADTNVNLTRASANAAAVEGLVDTGATITVSDAALGSLVDIQFGSGADTVSVGAADSVAWVVKGATPNGLPGDTLRYLSDGVSAFSFSDSIVETVGRSGIQFSGFESYVVDGDLLLSGGAFDDELTITATNADSGQFQLVLDATGTSPTVSPLVTFNSATNVVFAGQGGDDVFTLLQPAGSFFAPSGTFAFHGGDEVRQRFKLPRTRWRHAGR